MAPTPRTTRRPAGRGGKTVAVLYGALPPEPAKDDLDTLKEVRAVSEALSQLGCKPVEFPLSLHLDEEARRLLALKPRFVFNLVEDIAGSGRLIHLAPALLDRLGFSYTGAPTEAMFLTSCKLVSKRIMDSHGIPTTPWTTAAAARGGRPGIAPPWIVKNAWEHASLGVSEEGIARDRRSLQRIINDRYPRERDDLFIETYVDGREFSVALVGPADRPAILPPSEILFLDYPAGKPRIVDYRAKWEEESFEYTHTPRHFEFGPGDRPLLEHLKELAVRCWNLFGLAGYVRVDFRVTATGEPLVMEINANPCISPDAGFAATAEEAGLSFTDLVRLIIEAVPRNGSVRGAP